MNATIIRLVQHPKGLWMQGMGRLKRSAGAMLHIEHVEHAGRSQLLAGLVLRHGGISREEAQRAVGSFSEQSDATTGEGVGEALEPSAPLTMQTHSPAMAKSGLKTRRLQRVWLHRH